METPPILSVIIPAFNVKAYIREAVVSALRQTWRELEVIVIDDGSTDGTLEALADIDDPRLHRVQKANAGLAAARNSGIQAAQGIYLGFLDGDDVWDLTKAERHLRFLDKHPEIDLTFSYALMVDESGHEIAPLQYYGSGELGFQDLMVACPHCNAIVRREAVQCAGFFDTDLSGAEDLDMWLRIALQKQGNVHCIPEFLAYYRRRTDQLSGDWANEKVAWQQIMGKYYTLVPEEIRNCAHKANQRRSRYYAFLAYEKRRYGEALGFLHATIRQAPWNSLIEGGTWSLAAACLSGLLLPARTHQRLQRKVRHWRARNRKTPQSLDQCRDEV